MNSLDNNETRATSLKFVEDYMDVYLEDGRMLRVPLEWYPRLERASMRQRKKFEWLYDGLAIHWPDIDEDLSVAGFLRGERAPRTPAYLYGIWSEKLTRERAEIEAKDRAKRSSLRTPRRKIAKAKH